MKKPIKLLSLTLLVFLLISSFTACGPKTVQQLDQEAFVLGTFGSIRIFTDAPKKGKKIIDQAFARITEIENRMSTSVETSEIAQLNRLAGQEAVEVSPDTLYVIQEGIAHAEKTQGNFDIGIGALVDLWGVGKEWQKVPTQEEIDQVRNHIDIQQVEINGSQVYLKDSDMMLDLGGIAKGYAVDEAVRVLRENGIDSGFVNLGGDVYAIGTKSDGSPWMVGIENPEIGVSTIVARLPLVDQSIVTSGNYERFFIEDGQLYHHIIDPATGYPSDNELVSVTIISDKGMYGDIYSTATFIMGLEKGMALVEGIEGMEGVFITKDKQIYATAGIIDKLELLDEAYTLHK